MLDIKYIRDNQEKVREAIKNKKVNLDLDRLLERDEKRRFLIQKTETIRAEQKKAKDREHGMALKHEFKANEGLLVLVEKEFNELMLQVPNIPTEDTPV